jgi:hypothetical protein
VTEDVSYGQAPLVQLTRGVKASNGMQFSDKSNLINVIGIRAERRPDGGLVLTIGTRYAGETSYFLSNEVMQPLVSELSPAGQDAPSSALSESKANNLEPSLPSPANESDQAGKIAVRTPKRWVLGNGLPNRAVVVLVVDPHTEQQAGYAFDAKAAREMGAHLIKNADAIDAHNKQPQK